MAGFRKAKPKQVALKMALFGPPGSGKTFTALLIAEGLAKASGKRIALVDTEHGSDFYASEIQAREVHPEAFDFDALYTRSLTEVMDSVMGLSADDYCCVVIDSMTHLWEAAKGSYTGRVNSNGQLPFHAWGKIKKPYKRLENFLLNSPLHVILCGRQGVDYQEDDSGEMRQAGFKMKAEGETPYEPNVLLRLEPVAGAKNNTITAIAEKDRTGILAGKRIEWPCFENIAAPILAVLTGDSQAQIQDAESARAQDVDRIAKEDLEKTAESAELRKTYAARYQLARSWQDVDKISQELTGEVKAKLTSSDLSDLREAALSAMEKHPKPKKKTKPELLDEVTKSFEMLGVAEEEQLGTAAGYIDVGDKVRKLSDLKVTDLETLSDALMEEMAGSVDG